MRGQDATDDRAVIDDDPDIGDLFDRLEELSETVDTPEERAVVEETLQLAADTQHRTALGRVIWGFDRADAAEALLGSLLLGIPMAVEGEGHRRWARSSPPARSSSPGPPCSRSCSRPACCTSPRSRMSVEDSLFAVVLSAITVVGLVVAFPLWVYGIYHAYQTAKGDTGGAGDDNQDPIERGMDPMKCATARQRVRGGDEVAEVASDLNADRETVVFHVTGECIHNFDGDSAPVDIQNA